MSANLLEKISIDTFTAILVKCGAERGKRGGVLGAQRALNLHVAIKDITLKLSKGYFEYFELWQIPMKQKLGKVCKTQINTVSQVSYLEIVF